MTPEAARLWAEGPCVRVHLSDATLPDDEQQPQEATLLVDTGAELTILPRDAIDALGLARVDVTHLAGVIGGARVRCPIYLVRLTFPDLGVALDLEAGALAREDGGADGLLGRDALAALGFTYDGPGASSPSKPGDLRGNPNTTPISIPTMPPTRATTRNDPCPRVSATSRYFSPFPSRPGPLQTPLSAFASLRSGVRSPVAPPTFQ